MSEASALLNVPKEAIQLAKTQGAAVAHQSNRIYEKPLVAFLFSYIGKSHGFSFPFDIWEGENSAWNLQTEIDSVINAAENPLPELELCYESNLNFQWWRLLLGDERMQELATRRKSILWENAGKYVVEALLKVKEFPEAERALTKVKNDSLEEWDTTIDPWRYMSFPLIQSYQISQRDYEYDEAMKKRKHEHFYERYPKSLIVPKLESSPETANDGLRFLMSDLAK